MRDKYLLDNIDWSGIDISCKILIKYKYYLHNINVDRNIIDS